jgi:hypothetical protein
MKTTLKVTSIIAVVLGGLALINGLVDIDGYAIIGGLLFGGQGIVGLIYIGQQKD